MAMQMLGEMNVMLGNQAYSIYTTATWGSGFLSGPSAFEGHVGYQNKKSVCKLIINVLALLMITSLII